MHLKTWFGTERRRVGQDSAGVRPTFACIIHCADASDVRQLTWATASENGAVGVVRGLIRC